MLSQREDQMRTVFIDQYRDYNGKGYVEPGFPTGVSNAGQEYVTIGTPLGKQPVLIKVADGPWPFGQRATFGGDILECDLERNADDLLIKPQTGASSDVLAIWRVYSRQRWVSFEVAGPAELVRQTAEYKSDWGDYSSANGEAVLLRMSPGSTATAFHEDRAAWGGRVLSKFRLS